MTKVDKLCLSSLGTPVCLFAYLEGRSVGGRIVLRVLVSGMPGMVWKRGRLPSDSAPPSHVTPANLISNTVDTPSSVWEGSGGFERLPGLQDA